MPEVLPRGIRLSADSAQTHSAHAEMAYTTQPVTNYDMAQCYNAGLPAVNLGFSLPPAAPPLKLAIGYSQYVNPDEFANIDCDVFDEEELFAMGTDAEHWADDLGQTLG